MRVVGVTADIETGKLLIIKRCLCSVVFCNYKCKVCLESNETDFLGPSRRVGERSLRA